MDTTGGDFGGGNTAASTQGSFLSRLFGGGGSSGGPALATTTDLGTGDVSVTPGTGSTGGGGFLSGLTSNPLALLGIGALGYNLLSQPSLPNVKSEIGPIQGTAGNLTAQGTQLASYLQSGQLPPGVQQGITQASDQAKAAIRSKYAAMGDTGSSAEAQDLANVDVVAQTQGAGIAMQLLQTGINESQLGAALYTELLNATLNQSNATGAAIANFASAMVPRTVITQPSTTTG